MTERNDNDYDNDDLMGLVNHKPDDDLDSHLTSYKDYSAYNTAKERTRKLKDIVLRPSAFQDSKQGRGHFKENVHKFQQSQRHLDIIRETIDVVNNLITRCDRYVYYVDVHDYEGLSSEVHATIYLLPEILKDMENDITELHAVSNSIQNDFIHVAANVQINNHDEDIVKLEVRSSSSKKHTPHFESDEPGTLNPFP